MQPFPQQGTKRGSRGARGARRTSRLNCLSERKQQESRALPTSPNRSSKRRSRLPARGTALQPVGVGVSSGSGCLPLFPELSSSRDGSPPPGSRSSGRPRGAARRPHTPDSAAAGRGWSRGRAEAGAAAAAPTVPARPLAARPGGAPAAGSPPLAPRRRPAWRMAGARGRAACLRRPQRWPGPGAAQAGSGAHSRAGRPSPWQRLLRREVR